MARKRSNNTNLCENKPQVCGSESADTTNMGLFCECKKLFQKNIPSVPEFESTDTEIASIQAIHTTVPAVVIQSERRYDAQDIYYISDLHLVDHLLDHYPEGATDEEINQFIHEIVLKLFHGEIRTAIQRFKFPVVLFGGDVSSSFRIARLFYADFVKTWDALREESYARYSELFASIEAELNDTIAEIDFWKGQHPWIKQATKPLWEYTDKKVPRRIKDLLEKKPLLKKQIDKIREELQLGFLWRSDYERAKKHKFIYSILGNHELWSFATYEDCEAAYKNLFEELRIVFLFGSFTWLGPHYIPFEETRNPETGKWERNPINRDDKPKEYNEQMLFLANAIIVGDIGYAPLNKKFNASNGIYGIAINPKQEEERCRNWLNVLEKARKYATEYHCPLVVLTHMPVTDWLRHDSTVSNCVYFSGHTHHNAAWASENNVFVYADGQVGYKSNYYQFRHTRLYQQRNPFAADPDGFREITCEEYKEFYCYVNEAIPRTGSIERQIKQNGSKLYAIKQDDYYGFFVVTPSKVCICNGGQLRAVGLAEPLNRYNDVFMQMVNAYLRLLSPLRSVQEKISEYIKSIGGTGRIHGTIVDIDYENHIMVNTNDGSLSFYYSPFFGLVKSYSDFGILLHEHRPDLEKRYLADSKSLMIVESGKNAQNQTDSYEKIDIKNSPYVISRRINALQRLFDKHILRDWNEAVINRFREKDGLILVE